MTTRIRRVQRVVVVVPAHNEEALLPGCLVALRRAAARSPVPLELVVVADACEDRTADTVPRVNTPAFRQNLVAVHGRNVGAARRAGAGTALSNGARGLWIATTDADTVVHPDWITHQLAHAERGADLVLGTVAPRDWTSWDRAVAVEYRRSYVEKVGASGHGHIHGANLGVAAEVYVAAGGFLPLASSEDVALVRAVRASGGRVITAMDVPVLTSTRRRPRAPAGFGDHLQRIAAE